MNSNRQLAAIMFTDIVGYTALMGRDEKKAFELLVKNREIQKPIIEQFNGRWIKELGDGALACFNTVSDAVCAAIKIQESCNTSGDFQLRIGIHQGEVVIEDNDVFGDAVNIASRIQAITKPGSIYVSEAVHSNVSNKRDIKTRFVGEEDLKNVKEPVKIYEVVSANAATPSTDSQYEPDYEKGIVVLPFVNMSNDTEQEYFCDGISEEIMNALSQLDNLRVIARTSAFSFKGKNLDVRAIGKALNVRTLLEGSVRKSGNNLRITTKLVNVSDGSQLWSEKYDRVLEDVFSIQENIAENVATALRGVLTHKEKEQIRRPETNIEAYEYFLKGRQLFHHLALFDSIKMFEKAIKLDPAYAPAYAGLADAQAWIYEWEGGDLSYLISAEDNSQKALLLAPGLPESHASRGYILTLAEKYDDAEKEFKEAIQLSANSYDAYYYYARSCFARGQTEKSAELFQKASQVRPEDFQSMVLLAQSLRVLQKVGEARDAALEGIRRARKQLELNPTDKRILSLTSGTLFEVGLKEEAFGWINRALELYPEDAGVIINAACLYARDGNKEMSLHFLETAVGKGFGKRDWFEHDPDYDSLRHEPRFKALLEKLQ